MWPGVGRRRHDGCRTLRRPRRVVIGLTAAIVALPLAPGFGVSSGLGAEAGPATAVIAGVRAAVCVRALSRRDQLPVVVNPSLSTSKTGRWVSHCLSGAER